MSKQEAVLVNTPFFIVNFPEVFTPKAFRDQDPKYSLQMIFPKGTKGLKEFMATVRETIAKEYPKGPPASYKQPFRSGDKEGKKGIYEGAVFCTGSASGKNLPPGLIGPDNKPILDTTEFYSGCWAMAKVQIWLNEFGASLQLRSIKKFKDGKKLFSHPSPEEDFRHVAGLELPDGFEEEEEEMASSEYTFPF